MAATTECEASLGISFTEDGKLRVDLTQAGTTSKLYLSGATQGFTDPIDMCIEEVEGEEDMIGCLDTIELIMCFPARQVYKLTDPPEEAQEWSSML